ncbi:MAG: tetratricopeptide repeat protein [Anditalea sp.]
MKIKIAILVGLLSFAMTGLTQAQDNWKWPSDPQLEARAREYNASYNDYQKAEEFVSSTKPLSWLLGNTPDLNEALYINGVVVYAGAAEQTADEDQKKVYQDSVITLYDKREELFDNEEKWIENKAYYAYKFYRGDKDKIAEAVAIFDRALEIHGTITPNLVGAYFDLIYRNYAYNDAYTPDEVLSKYEQLSGILAEAEGEGTDISSPKGTLDQLLVAMEIIDCDFIENSMGPKLKEDPDNIKLAQEIFQYSLQYKCTSSPAFLTALEIIDDNDPTFSTSQARGKRYLQNEEYDKAEEMFEKAITLAKTDEQKGEVHFDLARLHSSQGRKSQARDSALEAANFDDSRSNDAYNLIGNLYMQSTNDCRGGQSRVKDYSIFIAAHNAFAKAGNNKGMGQAKARFPSKEEIFTEGFKVGETINTGCWIGQTVTLATRD